jgi:hypothetical protein
MGYVIGGAVAVLLLWMVYGGNTSNSDNSSDTGFIAMIGDAMSQGIAETWALAIQTYEGYVPHPPGANVTNPETGLTGSRSYRNNNPGNLRVVGDLGTDDSGFGVFSSYDLGFGALVSDLKAKISKYPNATLGQIMARYAPPSENNTSAYADYISQQLGVPLDTTMAQLSIVTPPDYQPSQPQS